MLKIGCNSTKLQTTSAALLDVDTFSWYKVTCFATLYVLCRARYKRAVTPPGTEDKDHSFLEQRVECDLEGQVRGGVQGEGIVAQYHVVALQEVYK